MEFFSQQASELHFHRDPLPMAPTCSEKFYVNHVQQGLIEAPTCTPEQPQYETASNIVWNKPATGSQSILVDALQGRFPLSAMAHQSGENRSESAACGVEPQNFQAVSHTQPPASTWASTAQQRRFPCNLCGYICSSENQLRGHTRAHTLSAYAVPVKQVRQESLAVQPKTAAPSGLRMPKIFRCTYCPKTYVREVYYLSHMEKHLKSIQKSGLNARNPAAPIPAPVIFDLVACPSSAFSMASPIVAASAVAGSLPAMEFPPPSESHLHLDDLDFSEALVFPSEEERKNFERLWEAMMHDIMVTNFGDYCA